MEHEERANIRGTRTSTSSGRPSYDALRTPAYTDVDSDEEEEEAARIRDPRAAHIASLVGSLVEGDELEEAGLFSEEDDIVYGDDEDLESAQLTSSIHQDDLINTGNRR